MMKRFFVHAIWLLAALPLAAAPLKVGMVNVSSLYGDSEGMQDIKEMNETKNKEIQESAQFRNISELNQKLKLLQEEYKKNAQPAPEDKEKFQKEAALLDMQRRDLELEYNKLLARLGEKNRLYLYGKMVETLQQIMSAVEQIGKEEGYDLIIDSTGQCSTMISTVVYFKAPDITQEVKGRLKRNAANKAPGLLPLIDKPAPVPPQ